MTQVPTFNGDAKASRRPRTKVWSLTRFYRSSETIFMEKSILLQIVSFVKSSASLIIFFSSLVTLV